MADAFVTMRYSESITILSGTLTPSTGTVTIVSCKVTLKDAAGAIAGGVNGATATGFIAGPQTAPYEWEGMDPIALALTEPTPATGQALYSLEFLATDSGGKRYSSTVAIVVKPSGS